MKLFKDVIKQNIALILLWFVMAITNLVTFLLYKTILEPFFYSAVLGFVFLIITILVQYYKSKKKAAIRHKELCTIETDWDSLSDPQNIEELDYQEMIKTLGRKLETVTREYSEGDREALDYYTNWVHQIKTPIAVMKLKLSEDTPENRALLSEVFRIEEYVDMVLQYIRLGSASNDLLIKEYSIDAIIKDVVRKYASQFVEKKIKLEYQPSDVLVITDKKWLTCILEQFVSNAIKYTNAGSVTIRVTEESISVSDTGIGIAKEDIPRIFEKGYTGLNGRIGEKSSGLGLYLAKKAADLISVKLHVDSESQKGSTFSCYFH